MKAVGDYDGYDWAIVLAGVFTGIVFLALLLTKVGGDIVSCQSMNRRLLDRMTKREFAIREAQIELVVCERDLEKIVSGLADLTSTCGAPPELIVVGK